MVCDRECMHAQVCVRVCARVHVSKGRPCDCAHIVWCARSQPCPYTCVISTHSTEVNETLAVTTLPLSPRSSRGEQGFLDQEGFRREDLGLMQALASLSCVQALPALSLSFCACQVGIFVFAPELVCEVMQARPSPCHHRVGAQSVLCLWGHPSPLWL